MRDVLEEFGEEFLFLWDKFHQSSDSSIERNMRLVALEEYLQSNRRTNNQEVINYLADEVLRIVTKEKKDTFVGMSGGDALGKSTLSRELTNLLKQMNSSLRIGILPLDSFMMDRDERRQKNLRGNDPRANRISEAREAIADLVERKNVRYFEYNHQTGQQSACLSQLGTTNAPGHGQTAEEQYDGISCPEGRIKELAGIDKDFRVQ